MKTLFKTALLMSLLQLISSPAAAQINLVQNGSFEDYTICPSSNSEVENCIGWYSAANSPDYFNECAPYLSGSGVSLPSNSFGFQKAYNGNAYMGAGMLCPDNIREIIRGTLIDSLALGIKYYISFKVSLGERTTKYASNKIGVLFTNDEYESLSNPAPLPANFAHFYSNTIITDTLDWTIISGSFIADSAYKYIMIGNFFDNNQTAYLTVLDSLLGECSYYFIDDVCVSTDSLTCSQTLSSTFVMPTAFSPNGDNINDYFRPYPEGVFIEVLRIYNRWGQKIYEGRNTIAGWDGFINGIPLPSDVYAFYLEVKNEKTGKTEQRSGSFSLLR